MVQLAHWAFAGDDDAAVSIFTDGRHESPGHAVGCSVNPEPAVLPSHDDPVAADPESPVARLEQCADIVRRQSVRARIDGDAAAAQLVQTAAVGADPDVTVAGGGQGVDIIDRQAFTAGERGKTSVAQAIQSVVGADPQTTFAVFKERRDESVRQAVAHVEPIERLAAHANETVAVGPDPQRPVAIPANGQRRFGGKSCGRPERGDPAAADASQSAAGCNPDSSGTILVEPIDKLVGQEQTFDTKRVGPVEREFQHTV